MYFSILHGDFMLKKQTALHDLRKVQAVQERTWKMRRQENRVAYQ